MANFEKFLVSMCVLAGIMATAGHVLSMGYLFFGG